MDEELRLRLEAQKCEIQTRDGELCPATLRHIGGARFECLGPKRHQWKLGWRGGEPILLPLLASDLPPEE